MFLRTTRVKCCAHEQLTAPRGAVEFEVEAVVTCGVHGGHSWTYSRAGIVRFSVSVQRDGTEHHPKPDEEPPTKSKETKLSFATT